LISDNDSKPGQCLPATASAGGIAGAAVDRAAAIRIPTPDHTANIGPWHWKPPNKPEAFGAAIFFKVAPPRGGAVTSRMRFFSVSVFGAKMQYGYIYLNSKQKHILGPKGRTMRALGTHCALSVEACDLRRKNRFALNNHISRR
jgi:hypothetical protein